MRMLVLGLIALCGAPAIAQCPATAVQEAVNVWVAVSQGQPPPDARARIDSLASACKDNAYVLKVAALTNGAMSARATDPDQILAHGIRARELAMAMRDVQPDNEMQVAAQVGQNWIPIRIFGDNFDKEILLAFFGAQQRSGRLAPEGQTLAPGEKLRACRDWDRVEAQEISGIIRDNKKTDLTAPLNTLDRLIAICASQIASGEDTVLLALRARAYYLLLTDNPQRAGGKIMMEKLLDDSRRMFALKPNGDSVYWSVYDRDRLAAFAVEFDIATGNVPPRAEWFKPGNVENALVVRSIAHALDDAWAIDEPKGLTGKYQTYRDLIAALYGEATASGNAAAAKTAIARAAKGQSDGSMRRSANKQRKAPPDYLWNWIDPALRPN